MKRHFILGVLLCSGSTFFGACKRDKSPTIATVGSASISELDLRKRLKETPAAYRQYMVSPEGRRQFVDLLVREQVLLEEAKSQGIHKEASYKKALGRYQDEAARRYVEYQNTLQVESVIRKLRSGPLAASDTDVEKYYNEHPEEYLKPLQIAAAHIMLATEAEAQAVQERLAAKESFERLAKALSKDPATAIQGGRLKPFVRGTFGPDFENAVFPLKVGEISGIVKTQFGFHIIKKLGEKTLTPRSLADVKEEIRGKLEKAKFDEWVAAKQATMGVKVNDDAVAGLSLEEPQKP